MSIFQGKLNEFPQIAVDNFTAETHKCTAFFLSHCHKDHMEGLESNEFLEMLSSSNNSIFLYCSETTKNLIENDDALNHLNCYTKGIPISQPTLVSIFDQNSQSLFTLIVTLISAGHCVGSVMFLFEGKTSSVLYTGDFRLSKGDIQKVQSLKTQNGVKKIKELYIDTTFCTPSIPNLPSREESKNAVVKLMKSWFNSGENRYVFIQCAAKYGHEFILKEVAKEFNTKIHVDRKKYSLYSSIPGMKEFVTLDEKSTKIHSCSWKSLGCSHSSLPCVTSNAKSMEVLRVKPSTLWIYQNKEKSNEILSYDERMNLHRVLYSMHASYEEIIDVVSYLKPDYIFPTVVPVDAHDVIVAFERLKRFLPRKVDKIAVKEDNLIGVKNDWSSSLHQNLILSPKRAKVCYSKLGIDDEYSIESLPSARRKRRNQAKSTECLSKIEVMASLQQLSNNEDNEKEEDTEEFLINGIDPRNIDNYEKHCFKFKNEQQTKRKSILEEVNENFSDIDDFNIPASPGMTEPTDLYLADCYCNIHTNCISNKEYITS